LKVKTKLIYFETQLG